MTLDNWKEIVDHDVTCEAAGCCSGAKFNISLAVGNKGTISVFLCENCISKFGKLNRNMTNVSTQG